MDLSTLSDEHLIAQYRQEASINKDPELLSELVRRHQHKVVRKCAYYAKGQETARDVAQEVWIRVLTKLDQFRPDASFLTWLFTIVHNCCQDHIKRSKRLLHQEISQKILYKLEEELDTDDIVKLTIEILEELMEKLRGEEKLLLILKYQQGWSTQTIQQSLDLSESCVKSRLARTREKLQKLLDKYRQEHSG